MAKYRKKPVVVQIYKGACSDVKNFIKKACCKIGWHSYFVGFYIIGFDGLSFRAKCKWCGKRGLLDSYGQLF